MRTILSILLLLLAAPAWALGLLQGNVQDRQGNAKSAVSIEVYELDQTTKVLLYADADKAAQLVNPISSDTSGYYEAYCRGGYVMLYFSGTGITDYWEKRYVTGDKPNINVVEMGAVADDGASDLSAFQAAADSAYALGGAEIIVPPGEFTLSSGTIELYGNTSLVGVGRATKITSSANYDAIHATGKQFIEIRGIWFHGPNETDAPGVDVRAINFGGGYTGEQGYTTSDTDGCNDFTIEGCYFDEWDIGVAVYASERGRIANNHFDNIVINAVRIHSGNPSGHNKGHIVTGNIITECDNSGIHLHAGDDDTTRDVRDCVISGNQIDGHGDHGITLEGGNAAGSTVRGCTITGNTITNGGTGTAHSGILLRDRVVDCTVSANAVRGNDHGIYLYSYTASIDNEPSRNSISGNMVVQSDSTGIRVNGARHNDIIGNTVDACGDSTSIGVGDSGIWLESAHYTKCNDNTVFGSAAHGIYANACNRSQISLNECYDNGFAAADTYSGIFVTGSTSRSVLIGNSCYDRDATGQMYGIEVDGAGCTNNIVTSNMLHENDTGGLNDTGTTTTTDNNISS